ncbi:MAG TPA: alanine--tRNA ligase [Epulopiscium sp.]|nr:alanine--tRNA ligase [Candidatus Epulonipiscium sp.]
MKKLGLNELREMYLEFFEGKDHLRVKSFPLVPQNDKSLLLVNAGMAPLKPYFTGQEVPPNKRMTTCQKCIRTGDIENVGKTARHATFFEMLGNFSFGDYFKEEAIAWAWEFLVDVLEIPKEKLYISVYEEDQEAADIWHNNIHVPKEKIFFLGKEDNFWEVGVGPSGPCSEIHYDRGEKYGCGSPDCQVGCDCDRFMEVWNLVFTQFNKEEDGSYTPLPNPNIDTGMGLERLAAMMQDVHSIFDVDTIKAVRDHVCRIAGVTYGADANNDISIRIITDHIRSSIFMASDGVLPSNEGRGYVMRRLIRRAVRHGKLLGIKEMFLVQLSKTVIANSKHEYTELEEKADYITKILSVEEERFNETIDHGLDILKTYIKELKEENKTVLSGEDSFKLYDTYGFPLDLTKEILEEEHLSVDEESFTVEMNKQRDRARKARGGNTFMGSESSVFNTLDTSLTCEFVGYDNSDISDATILIMTQDNEVVEEAGQGANVSVITDKTPFYAEGGGQAGDIGLIITSSGKLMVTDTIHAAGNKIVHMGMVVTGTIKTGEVATMEVDGATRLNTARNHTATHLAQQALRDVLGSHIEQAGSNVNSDRLRFDFSHFEAMTSEQIKEVEAMVNQRIFDSLQVVICEKNIDEARKMGATALFGEKYGDVVRVVSVDVYSIELCGGTHITNTSQISLFKILSENGVSSGVRRIEAVTGPGALEYYKQQEEQLKAISTLLKTNPDQLANRIETLSSDLKEAQRQLEVIQNEMNQAKAGDVLSQAEDVNGVKLLTIRMDELDMNGLRNMGDKLKDKLPSGVIVLGSGKDAKVSFVVMATKEAVDLGVHAGNIISEIAKAAGGGGGGRPNMAQAGGKDLSKIDAALSLSKEILKSQMTNRI